MSSPSVGAVALDERTVRSPAPSARARRAAGYDITGGAGAAFKRLLARLLGPLLAVLLVLAGWLLPGASALANDAHLILVAGEVELRRPVVGGPVQVLVPLNGAVVQAGDTLITGLNGRVQLRFSDGSLISVQPRSEFRIDAYQFDMQQQRGFFSLVRGALRTISGAVGKRDPDDYRMTTPTATIGIRGTEYLLEETTCTPTCYPGKTAGTRVSVNSGFVVVFNPAGSIELPAGGASYVPSAARPPVFTTERPTMSTAPASEPASSATPAGTKRSTAGTPSPAAARTPGGTDPRSQRADARGGSDRNQDGVVRTSDAKNGGGNSGGRSGDTRQDNEATRSARRDAQVSAGTDVAQVAERRTRMLVNEGEGVPAALLERWNPRDQPADEGRASGRTAGMSADGRAEGVVSRPAVSTGREPRNEAAVSPAHGTGVVAPAEANGEAAGAAYARAGTVSPAVSGTSAFQAGTSQPGTIAGGNSAAGGLQAGSLPAGPLQTGAFQPTTEALPSLAPAGPTVAAEMGTAAIQGVVAQTGYGGSTAPVGDASATNVQRDPEGLPVAIVAIVADPGAVAGPGPGGTDQQPPTVPPGTTPAPDPVPDPVPVPVPAPVPVPVPDPVPDPGSGPGTGLPLPVPSFANGDLMEILLQSHQINSDLIPPSAVVGLDSSYRLDSIGPCPVLDCLSRGTAQVADAGYNSDLSWGRWMNGTARFTGSAELQAFDLELGSNNGIHYLAGVPTLSMPVSGTAYYALGGATSPTFSSGLVAPGTFTGEGLVSFGSGLTTRIGLQGNVIFGSGENYRLSSNGVQDAAGRLVEIGNSPLQMTGRTTFGGNIDVTSQGSSDRLGCTGSSCQATVRGGFYGPEAARMGIGYSVGRVVPDGGDTIHGVAVLNRQ